MKRKHYTKVDTISENEQRMWEKIEGNPLKKKYVRDGSGDDHHSSSSKCSVEFSTKIVRADDKVQ